MQGYQSGSPVRPIREGSEMVADETSDRLGSQAPQDRLQELSRQLAEAVAENARLSATLSETRDQVLALRNQVEFLSGPPSGYGRFLSVNPDDTVNVFTGGRKLTVGADPSLDLAQLSYGQQVMLGEAMNVIRAGPIETVGEIVTLQVILDNHRAIVVDQAGARRVVQIAESLHSIDIRADDPLLLDIASGIIIEALPSFDRSTPSQQMSSLTFDDIGGLESHIKLLRDLVELPILHQELFSSYGLKQPKGILIYGPAGCGKTMLVRALVNELRRYYGSPNDSANFGVFLQIIGTEILSKYVGETEQRLRTIFKRAKARSRSGPPSILFFDNMDSLFGPRHVEPFRHIEKTLVPQFVTELDSLEHTEQVIVIGATSQEDMLDPALLRSGRFDTKLHVERPTAKDAAIILAKHLQASLPKHERAGAQTNGEQSEAMMHIIKEAVKYLYSRSAKNQVTEVIYASGAREPFYIGDFVSGALIAGIAERAKLGAIKRHLSSGSRGVSLEDLLSATAAEVESSRALPGFLDSAEWSRISATKGEPIVYIKGIDVTLLARDREQ